MNDHRWSGWPGAWCLDCGQECKDELLMAGIPEDQLWNLTDECKEPGSQRHNPYAKKVESSTTIILPK